MPVVQLTSHTDYALRLLIYLLCRPGQNVSTREMATAYGISLHHLTKVAKSLTRGGWLVTARGGGGGLRLASHTPEAKVGDVIRFTENLDLLECFVPEKNTCPIVRACELRSVLHQARAAFFAVLDRYQVRDLARNPEELNRLFLRPPQIA